MSLGLGSVCVFEPVPLKQKGTYLVRTPVSYPVYFFFFFFKESVFVSVPAI